MHFVDRATSPELLSQNIRERQSQLLHHPDITNDMNADKTYAFHVSDKHLTCRACLPRWRRDLATDEHVSLWQIMKQHADTPSHLGSVREWRSSRSVASEPHSVPPLVAAEDIILPACVRAAPAGEYAARCTEVCHGFWRRHVNDTDITSIVTSGLGGRTWYSDPHKQLLLADGTVVHGVLKSHV